MKRFLIVAFLAALAQVSQASPPLRVFIRGGVKSHGPNAHEHERFLNDSVRSSSFIVLFLKTR